MKILITGVTSGLGQRMASLFSENGMNVIGVSRQNNYDITLAKDREKIVERCVDVDVIINNAHAEFSQTQLLYELFESYKNTKKCLVNIGSNSSDGIKNFPHPYAVEKAALDKACEQLQLCESTLRIVLLRFGWLNTPRVETMTNENKIDLDYAAKIVLWTIQQPAQYNIENLTIKPRQQTSPL